MHALLPRFRIQVQARECGGIRYDLCLVIVEISLMQIRLVLLDTHESAKHHSNENVLFSTVVSILKTRLKTSEKSHMSTQHCFVMPLSLDSLTSLSFDFYDSP